MLHIAMDLPRTPLDRMKFGPVERLQYEPALAVLRILPLWRRAAPRSGDLATMRWLDKLYWLHKARYPVQRPQRNSALEAHFAKHASCELQVARGFRARSSAALSAVGDLSPHAYLRTSEHHLFAEVADVIFDVDLSMANLECVVAGSSNQGVEYSPKSGPTFCFDPVTFGVVKGRFQFMATACNHSLDMGPMGVDETIEHLDDAGVLHQGTNLREEDASSAGLVTRNGIRFALLSWTFGLNAHAPPPRRPRIVNVCDLNGRVATGNIRLLEEQVRNARTAGADFVIAHLHWGMEHEFSPTPSQVAMAHYLAERGVDAIIGHHPHVVQPLELYQTRRDPNRVVPIYYSLGNLVNPFSAPWLTTGWVARMEVALGTDEGGNSRAYVTAANTVEVQQHSDARTQTLTLRRTSH
ncbi:MAG: CapA family protein [Polyangiaceae bacterium]|nr:CapA family protein [Polyangiaceae bacterium]